MIKRIGMLIVAVIMAVSLVATPAFAANAPAGCDKVRGTIVCQEEGKNPKFTQTITKKGSLQSSHEPETTCTKPCPPGQFK